MSSANQSRGHLPVLLRSVAAGLLAVGASQAMALGVTLCAEPYTVDMPGTPGVPMWGYRQVADASLCSAVSSLRTTAATPAIALPANDTTLTVTLVNRLPVPTSIVLAGQSLPVEVAGAAMPAVMAADVVGPTCVPTPGAAASAPEHPQNCRVRSFTGETDAGAQRIYTFNNVKPGSYLYQSGTHPQVQIQMGLFGMLTKDATPSTGSLGGRYLFANPDWVFDADATVLLSEIDDAMHTRIASTLGSANPASWKAGNNSTFDYNPRFFLVNGRPYDGLGATDLPISTYNGAYVVLRIANAGLKSRSLVLNDGHWQVLTEDGNPYPAPREQFSLLLPAGKTTDAQILANVPASGTDARVALFDRRGGTDNADTAALGGQVARLVFSNGGTAPTDLADLTIGKSDGVATVFVGDQVVYTIVVSNAGPNAVVDAPVSDVMPASLAPIGWVCTASVGSSCAAPSGSGNIATTVSLLNGGSATFTVTATVGGVARSMANTATVTVPTGMTDRRPGNNAATDIDTVLVRTADLSVTKTNGLAGVIAGAPVTYTVVASNAGTSNSAASTTVTDTLPAALTAATWNCTASPGSSCAASGAGSIAASPVTLAIGGSATFTVNATVAATATGTLLNSASIAVPAAFVDPNAANNTASDSDPVLAFPVPATLDTFTRANANNLGASWSQAAVLGIAALRVNTNQAFANSAGTAYWNGAGNVFGAKQAAAFTIANATLNGDSLILKSSGALLLGTSQNFIRVSTTGAVVTVQTTTSFGVANTTTGSFATTLANGNRLTALANPDGSVDLWKTAAGVTSYIGRSAAAAGFTGTGRIGMQLPTGARVDDFAGGTVTP